MAGTVLDLTEHLVPDQLGHAIGDYWRVWDIGRDEAQRNWLETRKYIFATDTTTTTNSKLPWSNKTTVPKLTQIRDNLFANYMATLFPKQKWMIWEGATKDDETDAKRTAIEAYMQYVVEQPRFKATIGKLVLDYIDYGNCFATPEWVDETSEAQHEVSRVGYVGPVARRISPLNHVFNPIAEDYVNSPKIFRSIHSLGEIKQILEAEHSSAEDRDVARELFEYLKKFRNMVHEHSGTIKDFDEQYQVDGFTNFQHYLESDTVELLTFIGDIYDVDANVFLKNHIIIVADRHKVITKKPNPSVFGTPPYYHAGWRIRQDNLWAMGPLDNLVGMQYRMDHLENLKADMYDLHIAPPLKISGYVEEFTWAPEERIHVGDDGDVNPMPPDATALQTNFEIDQLADKMEQMAGAPKEALGIRSPGEKTAFEIQRLESAASRIFQQKVTQFEEQIMQPLLNGMLELAHRHLDNTVVRILSAEDRIAEFLTLTKEDISGVGVLKPVAARHFAEKANLAQNITSFYQSGAGSDPAVLQHISSIGLAFLYEDIMEIEDFGIVDPYIRLHEQGEAEKLMNSIQEGVAMEAGTPSGLAEDDADPELGDPFNA